MKTGKHIMLLAGVICFFAILTYAQVPTNGLIQHLRADAIDTNNSSEVRIASGSIYVKNWIDQSGLGNDAVQATDSYQPLYITKAVNNLPALRFDGINDFMTFATGARPYPTGSVWIVMKSLVQDTKGFWQTGGASSNPEFRLFANSRVALWTQANGYAFNDVGYPNGLGRYSVLQLNLRSGYSASMIQNKGSSITSSVMTIQATVASENKIGTVAGGTYGNVEIAEIVMYNRLLSTAESDQLANWLMNKYAITTTLPSLPRLVPTNGLIQFLVADNIDTNNVNEARISGTNIFVREWRDISSKASHACQLIDDSQPRFVPNFLNGHAVIRFDGVNDRMSFPPVVRCYPNGAIFLVVRVITSGANGLWQTAALSYNPEFRLLANGEARLWIPNYYAHAGDAYGSLTNWSVLEFNLTNNAKGIFVKNGSTTNLTQQTMNMSGTVAPTDNYIGWCNLVSGNYGHLEFAAIVVYNRVLSKEERNSLGWYFSDYYKISTGYKAPPVPGTVFMIK